MNNKAKSGNIKKLDLSYIIMLLVLVSCSAPSTDGYEVKGKLQNGAGKSIYIDELTAASATTIDSAVIDQEGNYFLEGEIAEPGFFRMRLEQNNFVNIILNPGDRIELNGDASYLFGDYEVKGSRDAILLYNLNEYSRKFGLQTDSIRKIVQSYAGNPKIDSVNRSLSIYYNNMVNARKSYVLDFIDNNTTSIVCLAALESMDPVTDLKYFVKVDNELYTRYPNSKNVKDFHVKVAQVSRLAVGSEAPQIVLNDPDGNTISLSSLRGKVVLIDFWASWCKPCRIENPNVVRLYNAYKDKGFEIYGVSLDKHKGAWVQAIKQDGLNWIHVSDLGFWHSAPVKLYDVQSIPQTYLIDQNGNIIAKGLRGSALEEKIKEILG
ncbi:MAG TPA: AhpC/TSA family protein [Flavobacteriales bacterium]|nr:AhpC/TSA family protein [Flavobacteriales bacterium]HIN39306.1 AhpC/TSA family protein [Flavobacteriales bacterium]